MSDKENNTYNVGDGFDIVWENNDDLKKKLINRIEALGLSKRKK